MKKIKSYPVILYTEILSRAIGSVEAEIEEWKNKCASFPEDQREALLAAATNELNTKLEALKTLYRFETGTDI